jgi:ribonuclease E
MFIDATHPEETRVVVVDGSRVDEFDFESQARRQLRGNIYLARVTRVEPSLQAAFVEYGGNRHGFLAFNEIHPDYYQIPHDDRKRLLEEERKAAADAAAQEDKAAEAGLPEGGEDAVAEARRRGPMRNYKIQEVIKRRQILLVQVVKEERGTKGAALTTYLSLAGRYCVLMPNTARGGGISRKITSATDRKRLKKIATDLEVPDGMGLIVRTAGAKRTKAEIKRDADYLMRLWEQIREQTLKSIAPCLIYEESNLVKRAIRDLYDKDIEDILVDGESAYREAKDFIRMLMPSHAKKVQPFRENTPLFLKHKIEDQLEAIYQPTVQLKSGGYLVINQTEALVAIDVNSGRATRERNIEQTALRTNLEAAEEACRQFRLRDLAGLIVVDFIDMEESKNVRAVEKKMRDCLKRDRARVQAGKISSFGLMELSRQRRRANLLEGSHTECPTCKGRGIVRSVESAALHVLRRVEEEGLSGRAKLIRVRTAPAVALYLLNEKRESLNALETRCGMRALVDADESMIPPQLEISRLEERREDEVFQPEARTKPPIVEEEEPEVPEEVEAEEEEEIEAEAEAEEAEGEAEAEAAEAVGEDRAARAEGQPPGEGGGRRRRRRRRRRRGGGEGEGQRAPEQAREGAREAAPAMAEGFEEGEEPEEELEEAEGEGAPVAATADSQQAREGEGGRRRRRRRGRRGGRGRRGEGGEVGRLEAGQGGVSAAAPSGMRVITPEGEADADEAAAYAPPPSRPEPQREERAPAPPPQPAPVASGEEGEEGTTPAPAPAPKAPPASDQEAEERRKRWQARVKSWLGG